MRFVATMLLLAACSSGEPRALRRSGQLSFYPNGDVLVADLQGHRVVRFAPDGAFVAAFGEAGIGHNQLWNFRSVTVLPDGGFAIIGQSLKTLDDGTSFLGELKVFDAAGEEVLKFDPGMPGATDYSTADSIALIPEGFLVADDEHPNLQVFARDGRFVRNIEPVPPLKGASSARWLGERIWVAEYRGHRVRRLGLDGSVELSLGHEGSGPGELKFPETVDVAPDGRVVVADVGNFRVAMFAADGSWLGELRPEPARPRTKPQIVDARFGPNDTIYVSDGKGNRVLVYDREGRIVRTITSW